MSAGGKPDEPAPSGGSGGSGGETTTEVFVSCAALKLKAPATPSGPQWIDADGNGAEPPFQVHCDMENHGGGWTLLANMIPESNLDDPGDTTRTCYQEVCANRAFARLPLGPDFRIDGADSAIMAESQSVTFVAAGVNEALRGRTLRAVLAAVFPTFVQAPKGTVVTHEFRNGKDCETWIDFGTGVCGPSLVVLRDPSDCNQDVFAVGVAETFDLVKGNCDGWPQAPKNNFPHALRFWTR